MRRTKTHLAAHLIQRLFLNSWYASKIMSVVTVIGKQHFVMLQILRSSLQPLPFVHMLRADGSEMSPVLGCFVATLRLGQRSCVAQIQVHEGVQTPLISYGHCISQEYPKPILSVKHVNLCGELALSVFTPPSSAKEYFLSSGVQGRSTL